MAQYNENTLPILKYLRWRKPLIQHPEFIRAKQKHRQLRPQDMWNEQIFPILWPEYFPTRNPEYPFNANDAVFGLSRIWPEFAEAAASRIEALSSTFVQAFQNSYETFLSAELFSELEGQRLQGTLIFPGGGVICYDFEMHAPMESDGRLTYGIHGNIIRLKNGRHLVCDMFEDHAEDGTPEGTTSWHDFERMEFHTPIPEKKEDTIMELLDRQGIAFTVTEGFNDNVMGTFDAILVYHLFKKYAPIEEIVSTRERRGHRDLPEIRTLNEVSFLDCSWYTTVIRNEGFSVKGHFRLQPCGPGRSEKKLIYIHEFQKHGYHRRARLLLENE